MTEQKQNTAAEQQRSETKNKNLKKWFKKLGWAGFLFFTIKGLIWLAIFLGIGSLFV